MLSKKFQKVSTLSHFAVGLRSGKMLQWTNVRGFCFLYVVGFEVFTVVTVKNAVFWDVAPCRSCEMNRHFGGTYRLHLEGRKILE
jgi:hypothetical protein